jgi:hypothetical protein
MFIESVKQTLINTQAQINLWYKNRDRDKRGIFDALPPSFFRLLEMVTIVNFGLTLL